MEDFGPFAYIMAIVAALVAVFASLTVSAIGKASEWAALTEDAPVFLVLAGPRAISIVAIVFTFMIISSENWYWFATAAALLAVICFWLILSYDFNRKAYTCTVRDVGPNGEVATTRLVVIGSENELIDAAGKAYKIAIRKHGAMDLCKFMSGYGNPHNTPSSIWPREVLARRSSNLILRLAGIVMSGVVALYIAASIVNVKVGDDDLSPRTDSSGAAPVDAPAAPVD